MPDFNFSDLTADELTTRMAALENSGLSYEDVAVEYEALSAARAKTGWTPTWLSKPLSSAKS